MTKNTMNSNSGDRTGHEHFKHNTNATTHCGNCGAPSPSVEVVIAETMPTGTARSTFLLCANCHEAQGKRGVDGIPVARDAARGMARLRHELELVLSRTAPAQRAEVEAMIAAVTGIPL